MSNCFKLGIALEENLIRFLNFERMGLKLTTLVLLIVTFTLYYIPIEILFKCCLPDIDELPQENYHSMKLKDPNVRIYLLKADIIFY